MHLFKKIYTHIILIALFVLTVTGSIGLIKGVADYTSPNIDIETFDEYKKQNRYNYLVTPYDPGYRIMDNGTAQPSVEARDGTEPEIGTYEDMPDDAESDGEADNDTESSDVELNGNGNGTDGDNGEDAQTSTKEMTEPEIAVNDRVEPAIARDAHVQGWPSHCYYNPAQCEYYDTDAMLRDYESKGQDMIDRERNNAINRIILFFGWTTLSGGAYALIHIMHRRSERKLFKDAESEA